MFRAADPVLGDRVVCGLRYRLELRAAREADLVDFFLAVDG
jgi:hypothetical protein